MSSNTRCIFGLNPNEPAVTPRCNLWSAPLPASRRAFGPSPDQAGQEVLPTYGDYFTAARSFLEQDRWAPVRKAVGRLMGRTVNGSEVARVAIYLVKHGAFYHPSYIRARVDGRWWPLVLNVAVRADGQMILDREFHNLDRLNRESAQSFWPQVFEQGWGRTADGRRLPMFLGQWLEGYHEFHLTADAAANGCPVAVWDTGCGYRYLTASQACRVLEQAAEILSYAYNPLTFEAIRQWHHAAGDFVVCMQPGDPGVRLISVRRYAPLVQDVEPDAAAMLEGLLVHLLEISLRLRLDRLDGIGQVACYPPEVIPSICRGFFQGLAAGAALRDLPRDFAPMVKKYCTLHGIAELLSMARVLAGKFAPHCEEQRLVQGMAEAHVAALADALAAT
jgi:hypothetical protein